MGRHRYRARVIRGHVAPPVPPAPQLAAEVPLMLRLERAVEDEFRPQMLARLQQRIAAEDAALGGQAPRCPECGRAMRARGRRATSLITRFGTVPVRPGRYRCAPCRRQERPLLTRLGVETGQVSGALARLLALLGVVVPYELAARLAHLRVPTPEAREALARLQRYYTEHRGRMRYDEYLRLGYGIGRGAVESAHKQVVHARLRQAGMRWSERGARHLLALRVLLLNDQWSLLDRLTMGQLAA